MPDHFLSPCTHGKQHLLQLLLFSEDTFGNAFYGLPHSALAEAYWCFGTKYKKRVGLGEYSSFLYKYVKSEVPNGLQAVVDSGGRARYEVLSRIHIPDIFHIINTERSLVAVAGWLFGRANGYIDWFDIDDKRLLNIVADKINASDDVSSIGLCFLHIYEMEQTLVLCLWDLVDKEKLAEKLCKTRSGWDAGFCVGDIGSTSPYIASELLEFLEHSEWKTWLCELDIKEICYILLTVFRLSEERGRRVWELVAKNCLADRLIHTCDVAVILRTLADLARIDLTLEQEICKVLDTQKLVDGLTDVNSIENVAAAFESLNHYDHKLVREILHLLGTNRLEKLISTKCNAYSAAFLVSVVYMIDSDIGDKLWQFLRLDELSRVIISMDELCDAAYCLERLYKANPESAKEVARKLNLNEFAKRLSGERDLIGVTAFIASLCMAVPEICSDLCNLLDLQKLVKTLAIERDILSADDEGYLDFLAVYIDTISEANKNIGAELYRRWKEHCPKLILPLMELGCPDLSGRFGES